MIPGTKFIYTGSMSGHPANDIVAVTHHTKWIAGIFTLVINDTGTVKGIITEKTLDYLAQDNSGNVWYFGESTAQIKNGVVTGHAGSWLAGVNGSLPGIVMEANPQVGDFYCQENAPGVAQDQAKVVKVTKSVCVPSVCTRHNAVLTKETTPLEPGTVDLKWYVLGVGNVKEIDGVGGQDGVELVAVQTS